MMLHTTACVIALMTVLTVSTATMTSHSSTTDMPGTTVTTTSKNTMSTTKRTVTEELEDKFTLGDKIKDTANEDDSDEVNDEPLPTLKPTKSSLSNLVLPTDLMPPKFNTEPLPDDWNTQLVPTQEPNVPIGLLIVRIIQIIKPKDQQTECVHSIMPYLQQKPSTNNNNNYKPMYSPKMTVDDMSSSEENGEKMPVTSSIMPQLRNYNSDPSYNNYPNYSPFRFASNNIDRPWFNVFRGLNSNRNYNY